MLITAAATKAGAAVVHYIDLLITSLKMTCTPERAGHTPNYLVKVVLCKRALQTSVCFKSFDGLYDLRVNYSIS